MRKISKGRLLMLAAVAGVLIVACATSPTGRHQLMLVSDAEVEKMGVSSFQDLKKKVPATKSAKESAYVQCVARQITTVVPTMAWAERVPASWEVVTFESDEVNAFALPGGKIGVYTGLLKVAGTQDQLAAVIGHEVSHVLAGHSAERVSNQMAAGLGVGVVGIATGVSSDALGQAANAFFILPFSRSHETEADLLGMDLMATAGFDPRQAITLWQNMAKTGGAKPPELLSTHPADQTRIRDLSNRLNQAMPLYQRAQATGRVPKCG